MQNGDEEYVVCLFDLDTPIEFPDDWDEDDSEPPVIEIEPIDYIDTWAKFRHIFGQGLYEEAKQAAIELEQVTRRVQLNYELMQKVIENIEIMAKTMSEDFNIDQEALAPMLNSVENIEKSLDSAGLMICDLKLMRSLLPVDEPRSPSERPDEECNEVNSDPWTIFEETRPFPNAWPTHSSF